MREKRRLGPRAESSRFLREHLTRSSEAGPSPFLRPRLSRYSLAATAAPKNKPARAHPSIQSPPWLAGNRSSKEFMVLKNLGTWISTPDAVSLYLWAINLASAKGGAPDCATFPSASRRKTQTPPAQCSAERRSIAYYS